jgi:glutamate-1-semialdehyde 2,1-aminomutase
MSSLEARAAASTPGGVHSNVRMTGPRVFIQRAKGAWMWDVDGKDYVDHLLGQGPNLLGHAPEVVLEAVADACRQGTLFGGQHALEIEASEAILNALGWPDKVRLGLTGTEMVQAALRLARAHTNRRLVVRFEGQYHGWLDNVLISHGNEGWGGASAGQVLSHLDDFLTLPFNDQGAVDDCFSRHGDEIACIITEPVMLNSGAIVPLSGFLEHLRHTADKNGALLIFDEVITGFRFALGGAAAQSGVQPDLAIYGKALAGGFPAAALVGSALVMDRLAVDTNHSGTFNGNVVSSSAIVATMSILNTQPPYQAMVEHGTKLIAGIRQIAAEAGFQINIHGLPSAFHVSFGSAQVRDWRTLQELDLEQYAKFSHTAVANGLWLTGRGVWYTSAAHGPKELTAALERFELSLSAWALNPTVGKDE